MTDPAEKFKAAQKKLAKLNRTIDDVQEQWLISSLINPLTFKQRGLEKRRRAVKAELQHLAQQLGVSMLGDGVKVA